MAKQNVGEVASLGDRRSHMTFCASITPDAEVQARLPQVLIGNERQLSAATMRNLTGLPENIHVWRCKSAWNSHALMRRYLSLPASSLGSVLKDRYVILILDVALCHLHPTILAHAKRCGIRLCYIPASMTAELQPCDTHLFARFKGAFQEVWRRRKSISPGGQSAPCNGCTLWWTRSKPCCQTLIGRQLLLQLGRCRAIPSWSQTFSDSGLEQCCHGTARVSICSSWEIAFPQEHENKH